ncbi:hypothetical protein [Paracoccus methylarcula]|uniref:CHRD domain-containing protein n=1 Tax=Paracoccus methylarcula TaxID=72022 RepID=A0A422QVN4_9RHOB|nr:hypothetical protein [Paracoccus methylarcula]RNF34010.1 hypothetical protein A7A09_013995 [Paracoccus methylarcula]
MFRYAILLPAFLLANMLLSGAGGAMEIASEYKPATNLLPPIVTVHLSGEIVPGDSEKLRLELGKHAGNEVLEIDFNFNSPGGSLIEGIRLAD